MKNTLKILKEYIVNCGLTLEYFFRMLFFENFKNYIKEAGINNKVLSNKIVILANGPSLKKDLMKIVSTKSSKNYDYCVVNYFANDPTFEVLKPKIYVLSDPQFLANNCFKEKAIQLYNTLNEKVSWPMNLYIQYSFLNEIKKQNLVTNENIKIVPFHSTVYKGFKKFRNYLFDKGLASADYGTVVHHCISISINLGYKELNLYGVDHTFFDGLMVNDKNEVCRKITHFYDTKEAEAEPIYHHYTKKQIPFTMSFFLFDHMRIFQGHEILSQYAKSRDVKILNRTKGSLIDAYTKL